MSRPVSRTLVGLPLKMPCSESLHRTMRVLIADDDLDTAEFIRCGPAELGRNPVNLADAGQDCRQRSDYRLRRLSGTKAQTR
jgi:hypothetical protein